MAELVPGAIWNIQNYIPCNRTLPQTLVCNLPAGADAPLISQELQVY